MPATRDNLSATSKCAALYWCAFDLNIEEIVITKDFHKEQCCDPMSASCGADAINAVHCLAHLPLLLLGSPASSYAPHSHRECFLQAQESELLSPPPIVLGSRSLHLIEVGTFFLDKSEPVFHFQVCNIHKQQISVKALEGKNLRCAEHVT
jgi:hypothetical protein